MNTIKKPDIPCSKGCKERNADCHINCIKYIAYRKALDNYNKKQRAIRRGINASYDGQWTKGSSIERISRKRKWV